jgi:hypothetical protein
MSLDEHSALIEQLKPLLMEPDFQSLFDMLTKDESNSTRFLLKMELNRIASTCTRIIDLRDKSELPCEEVIQGSRHHYLDEPARECFIESMALYRGNYTLGVYEHVVDTHRRRKIKLQEPERVTDNSLLEPFLAKGVVLGSYFNRSEERMNYSIRIAVLQPGIIEALGITVDLSVRGARIRLPLNHGLNLDNPIKVKLLELSEEYYYEELQKGVDYQIVDTQHNSEYCWMRLKRIAGSDALVDMLSNLIQGHKFRYKVDINDILVAAMGLGFERHYLPHLPHLPLFVESETHDENEDKKYKITHKLLSRDNQQLQYYFQDEKDISQLPNMITSDRIHALINEPDNKDHGLFFSFTFHTKGRVYFYSATLAELKKTDLLALFLSFGSPKPSWRTLKLTHHAVDHSKSYKSSLLPGDDSCYSALAETQLKRFSHVLQLIDLTDPSATEHYQDWNDKSDKKVNELKIFGQPKKLKNTIKLLSLQFSERRNEARFSFKTQITVTQGKTTVTGFTHDISSKGLQILLEHAEEFDTTAALQLSFPKLQTIAGKTQLSQLPYRLIRTRQSGVNLHLAAVMGHNPHIGVEFMNKLITSNRDKLEKLTEANSEMKELADGLKNLLMRHLDSVPYFIEKTVKSAKLSTLGVGTHKNEITDLFAASASQSLEYNLESLLKDGRLKHDFLDPIRTMNAQSGLDYFELYLQISRQSLGEVKVRCATPDEIGDIGAREHFINQSNNLGRFMALRVYRGVTEKPDLTYIRRELEYIAIHAHHKAKQLQELLRKIVAVGEFLDITEEVILRYPNLYQELNSETSKAG